MNSFDYPEHILTGLWEQIVFGGGFAFFVLTTPPKIGFQSLLQNMIAEEEATQVYGFVGTFLVACMSTCASWSILRALSSAVLLQVTH